MRNSKKLLAVIVAIALMLTAIIPAFAAEAPAFANQDKADTLVSLNLMEGSNGDLMLGKALTRAEGAVFALKLVGKAGAYDDMTDEDAAAILKDFTDAKAVPTWATKWVALAVKEKVMNGGNKVLNAGGALLGKDLASMIMNALGYAAENDYATSTFLLADKTAGGLSAKVAASLNAIGITRDQAVGIVYGSLTATASDADANVIATLVADDEDMTQIAIDAGLIEEPVVITADTADNATKTLTLTVGDKAADKLDKEATVTYSDKTTKKVAIKWADVPTTAAAAAKDYTGTVGDTGLTVKCSVTVNALAVDFTAEAANLKEVLVTFNQAVDATKLITAANYIVLDDGVSVPFATPVAVGTDNKAVKIQLTSAVAMNSKVEVTVGTGLMTAATTKTAAAALVDNTLPTVTDIQVTGLKMIKVFFSEPVQKANLIESYTINGLVPNAPAPTYDAVTKTATIVLNNTLAAGNNTIVVKTDAATGIIDFANLPVANNSTVKAITADTTAPTTVTVASASQTVLVVNFNKPISAVTSVTPSTNSNSVVSTATPPAIDATDKTKVTVTFNTLNPIPAVGATYTFAVVDMSGLSASIATPLVVPTVDIARPAYVGVSFPKLFGNTTMDIEFDKVVNNNQNVTIAMINSTNTDNLFNPTIVANTAAVPVLGTYPTATTTKKLRVTLPAGKAFVAGTTYTLVLSGVVDNTPLANVMVPLLPTPVTAPDSINPTLTSVRYELNAAATGIAKLYFNYNSAMDATAALNRANYSYYTAAGALVNLDAGYTLAQSNDQKTTIITFPANTTLVAQILYFSALNQKDLAGNELAATVGAAGAVGTLATGIYTTNTWDTVANQNPAPQGATLYAVSATQLKLQLNSANSILDSATIVPNDFVITNPLNASVASVASVSYSAGEIIKLNDQGNVSTASLPTITLNLATPVTMATNGTIGGLGVRVGLNSVYVNSKDIFARPLTLTAANLTAIDACSPTYSSVNTAYRISNTSVYVRLNLSEQLASAVGGGESAESAGITNNGQFVFTINGTPIPTAQVAVMYNRAVGAGSPTITLNVTGLTDEATVFGAGGTWMGKAYTVSYIPTTLPYMAPTAFDNAGRALTTFTASGVIQAAP